MQHAHRFFGIWHLGFVHHSVIRHSSFQSRMITLGDYLLVSGILFSIGFAGVMLRRNLIIILMSLELMFNAANLSLVAFSRFRLDPDGLPNYNAQVFVFFIITVAAAEEKHEYLRV